MPYIIDYPCNWLQVTENPMDPFHSVFLHTRISRAHFNAAWGAMPIVEWHVMPDKTGVWLTNTRVWGEYLWVRTAESLTPTFAQPPDIFQNPDREKFFTRVGISKWVLPVDNTHCQIIGWRHFGEELDLGGKGDRSAVGIGKVDFLGQTGTERSYAEAQREPSDYEAQTGQGAITIHALETLGKTDTGGRHVAAAASPGNQEGRRGPAAAAAPAAQRRDGVHDGGRRHHSGTRRCE